MGGYGRQAGDSRKQLFRACRSYWDIFNRPYGAIDLQDGLSNIIIRNNHFWERPAEAISVHNAQTNVVFDGVYVNGAGLSGQANDWSASNHTLGAGGFQNRSLGSLVFKNFELVEGSVPPPLSAPNLTSTNGLSGEAPPTLRG